MTQAMSETRDAPVIVDADWLKWVLTGASDPVLRRERPPSPDRRAAAAEILNAMQQAISHNRGTGKEGRDLSKQMVDSLDTLTEVLPLVEQRVRDLDETLTKEHVPGISLMADHLAALTDLRAAIKQNEAKLRFLDAMEHHPRPAERWRQIAPALADVFAEMMQRDYGLSQDGPVARFIAAVVPVITGETPKAPNVCEHLKKVRGKGKWEKLA